MAKQTVIGPYRVIPGDSGYEIVLRRDNRSQDYQRLIPRRCYAKEKRTSAYRALVLLNRDWQEEFQDSSEWPALLRYWKEATN